MGVGLTWNPVVIAFSVSRFGDGEYSKELTELHVFLLNPVMPVKRVTLNSSSPRLLLLFCSSISTGIASCFGALKLIY